MAFHSTQGPQLGLPQMIQSRPQFGYMGALLVWGVALIAYIGFNAFNQILAAQTLHSLYGLSRRRRCVDHSRCCRCRSRCWATISSIVAQRWVAYVLIAALLIFTRRGSARDAASPPRQLDDA